MATLSSRQTEPTLRQLSDKVDELERDIANKDIQYIKANLSANTPITMSGTFLYYRVPLNQTANSIGNTLKLLDTGHVYIGEGGVYRVSATPTANKPFYARIYRNSNSMAQIIGSGTSGYITGTFPPILVRCKAGDKIGLDIAKSTADDPTVAGTDTYLIVEKV